MAGLVVKHSKAWEGLAPDAVNPAFPFGVGRMAQAIAGRDWSGTALGPVESWPVSLKTIVRMMLQQRQAICIFWGPELTLLYNDTYAPILGAKEPHALGRPAAEVWSDVWPQILPLVRQALSGQSTWNENMPLIMRRNGYDEETYWSFSYSPIYDDAGAVAGMINITAEMTSAVISARGLQESLEASQRHTELLDKANHELETLQGEMTHRVKNTLAVTAAIVSQSLRHAKSLPDAQVAVQARLAALTKAQDFLTGRGAQASISEVVRDSLSPHVPHIDRARITGPDVVVTPQQALGLSLAVYELATNAVKYGALSNDQGRVAVDWGVGSEGQFEFTWSEADGPPVSPPEHTGFGSRLTNRVVAAYFSGTGETEFAPDGLRFVLRGTLMPPSPL